VDQRKKTRITRDRLLVADFAVEALEGTPTNYLTFTLPKKFKVWWQFRDLVRNGFWSVELLLEIEEGSAKLLEITPRGLTYKEGLLIVNKSFNYKAPTEAVAGWQLGLVKANLTDLTTHSIERLISGYTHLGGKSWKLTGSPPTEKEFQEIRAEVALKKRELFTPEKAEEVRKVLEQERKRAKESGTRYRGNEVLSEVFGVTVKTAEKWSAKVGVSAQKGRNKKAKRKGKNGNKEARK